MPCANCGTNIHPEILWCELCRALPTKWSMTEKASIVFRPFGDQYRWVAERHVVSNKGHRHWRYEGAYLTLQAAKEGLAKRIEHAVCVIVTHESAIERLDPA